ncbi:MAG TPA: class D sortase [Thermoanaerobaculaceae bacterium]|nr:class D sortase [Thermoanaerobaculaceae bacterium]
MRTLSTARGTAAACALATLASLAPRPANAGAPLREQDVPAYPPVTASDPVVGRITIARVGVAAAILEGVDDATIRRAVGHFPETPLPGDDGNVALAAHRTTDFYGLRHVRLGDEVTVTSTRGTFRYRVERMWVVTPEDVSVLDPAPGKVLTLVTCYPFDYAGSAPKRFIVRARAVDAAGPATVDDGAPGSAAPPPVAAAH